MTVKIKSINEAPENSDGYRVLVDRFWPETVSTQEAKINIWFQEIAPSEKVTEELKKDPIKNWKDFEKHYFQELEKNYCAIEDLRDLLNINKNVTLIYSGTNKEHNTAIALIKFLKL